jgi:uncharacterized membrane protein YphA (DoxX/SURF4 family)
MRYLLVFFGLLLGYTFIYAGVSKFWHGVTAYYNPNPDTVPSG